jgi:DNA-binding NarL/FixJ family response regulator
VDVLVAARDLRVRRALSGLLELAGHRVVGTARTAGRVLELDAQLNPGLVVLELVRGDDSQDLRAVQTLAARGRAVIAVCSGWTTCQALLAVGAAACLDKDDPRFTDRLPDAVRRITAGRDPEHGHRGPVPVRHRE